MRNLKRNRLSAWCRPKAKQWSGGWHLAKRTQGGQSHFKKTSCGLTIQQNLPKTFDKILVANRGEIACRIIRSCRQLGVRTVAVYSDVDADSKHVAMADEAFRLGVRHAADTYLRQRKLVDICERSGCGAVHPGYGFLSENADFAQLLEDSGVQFIGPPPAAIRQMGDKSASKRIMQQSQVPVVAGYHGADQSDERLMEESKRIGFPQMIKAVAGGGGRGIRPVFGGAEFLAKLNEARSEALSFFGSAEVLIEKLVTEARHIEFQVFADKFGNGVHLFERDCSVQRGNQKVFEECPAPFLGAGLRAAMGQAAVRAALACAYVGAGTVEFLFEPRTQQFFFMEMNTRLQVEHPVTEMVVGRDLVQWQLHVAAGHPLPASQSEITAEGFAIEARVYAENPAADFAASPGLLRHLRFPETSSSVRVESGVRQGDEVTSDYDAMIAKVIVHSNASRTDALEKMHRCLQQFEVGGIATNIEFLKCVLKHESFEQGAVGIDFVAKHWTQLSDSLKTASLPTKNRALMVACICKILANERILRRDAIAPFWAQQLASDGFVGFSTVGRMATHIPLRYGDETVDCRVVFDSESLGAVTVEILEPVADGRLSIANRSVALSHTFCQWKWNASGELVLKDELQQESYRVVYERSGAMSVFVGGSRHDLWFADVALKHRPEFVSTLNGWTADLSAVGARLLEVRSPIDCDVRRVFVSEGDAVQKGDSLVELEAMKKVNVVLAASDSVVTKVTVKSDSHVSAQQLLLALAPNGS